MSFLRISKLKEVLLACYSSKMTPMIVGHTGTGTTESVEDFATDEGFLYIPVRLGQMADPVDLIGLYQQVEEVVDGVLMRYTVNVPPKIFLNPKGVKVLIHLDEANRCQKDITQAVFQLLEKKKRLNGIEFDSDNTFVVVCINPLNESYVVQDFSDLAYKNRMQPIHVQPRLDDFIEWANKTKRIHPAMIATLQVLGDDYYYSGKEFAPWKPEDYVVHTNKKSEDLSKLIWYYEENKDTKISTEVFHHMLESSIGITPSLELIKQLEKLSNIKIPDGRELLNNTEKYEDLFEVAKGDLSIQSRIQTTLSTYMVEQLIELSDKELQGFSKIAETLDADLVYSVLVDFKEGVKNMKTDELVLGDKSAIESVRKKLQNINSYFEKVTIRIGGDKESAAAEIERIKKQKEELIKLKASQSSQDELQSASGS